MHMPPPPGGMNKGILFGAIAVFALLVGLVAGLTVLLLKDQEPATSSPDNEAPLVTEQKAAPAPVQASGSAPEAYAPRPLPPVTESTPEPASGGSSTIVDQLRQAREDAESKAAAEAAAARKAEEEARRLAAAKEDANPSVIDWLSQAKVTGVRISESGSKVILNGKAYSVGETVNYRLGLKIMVVQETRLLFIDGNGVKYMKAL